MTNMTNFESKVLENKADKVIALYKAKYMEDIKKDYAVKDNDTKDLILLVGDENVSHVRVNMNSFDDEMSVEEIVDAIHTEAEKAKAIFPETEDFTKTLLDFETAKEHLFVRLLNTERNQERLADVVTKPWHNLSMVLCIHVEMPDKDCNGVIQVQENLLKIWGKTVDELFDIALKNADEKFPVKLSTLTEFLLSMYYPLLSEEQRLEMKREILAGQDDNIQICRNENALTAAGFLYPSVLCTLCTGDYIIPSSTEECLIARGTGMDAEQLKEIICTVNQNEVSEEEFLSDNAYEYIGNGKFVMH